MKLPNITNPRLPPKEVPPEVYDEWVNENYRALADSGELEHLLRQRDARKLPDTPFVFRH